MVLRRLFGGGIATLLTRDRGYQLRLGDEDLDSAAFDRLVAAGRRDVADGRLEGAVEQLSEALALWRGPALADVPTADRGGVCGPAGAPASARWKTDSMRGSGWDGPPMSWTSCRPLSGSTRCASGCGPS